MVASVNDLFAPDNACFLCDEVGCDQDHLPLMTIPLTSDRLLVPHVIAPEDVWSPVTETGASTKLVAKGDPVSFALAVKYGWGKVPETGPGLPVPPARRQAPKPRATVD